MLIEVTSAANFLARLIRLNKYSGSLTDQQLEMFRSAVIETLRARFLGHWFPEKPCKGSGFRCIRINGKIDPVLMQAGKLVGIPTEVLKALFPSELTMWIDPQEVSYRFGENGSICVLYDEREVEELSKLNSLSSSPASSVSCSPSPSQLSASSCDEASEARNIIAFDRLSFVSS